MISDYIIPITWVNVYLLLPTMANVGILVKCLIYETMKIIRLQVSHGITEVQNG